MLPESCKQSANPVTPRTSKKTIIEPEIKVMAFAFGVMQSTTCYSRNENRDAHLSKPRHSTWSPPDPPLPRDMNVDETLKQVFPDLSSNSPTNRAPSTQQDESLCIFLNPGFGPSIMVSPEEVDAFRSIIGQRIDEFRAEVLPRVKFEEHLANVAPKEVLGIFGIEIGQRGESLYLDHLRSSPSDTGVIWYTQAFWRFWDSDKG
ncbi:hypothetical protein BDV97DRAFT_391872 [Delphinella strobiligena]|nr:hypothetical protein BDV97DRAFT_391872 [Delphinella strobiligena]